MTTHNDSNEPMDRFIDETAAAIREDRLDDDAVDAATARVWAKLEKDFAVDQPLRSCADVQALLPAYVAGELNEARSLLVGDHTRECVPCRRALLELRGGGQRSGAEAPALRAPRTVPGWLKRAAAALIVIGGGAFAVTTGLDILADRSLEARVASTAGTLQLVTENATTPLAAGDTFRSGERIRTARDEGAFLELADGSVVEMAPRSELQLHGSRKGTTIRLGRGNIIVHAADQGRGRLQVRTDECSVAVKGTIFAVNHGLKGSRVSVIEGEVEVRYGREHSSLLPGDQITTDERLRTVDISDEIAWSANAESHRELLAALTKLQHEVAEAVDIAVPRTSTRLLDLAPADTVIYAAMPNITDGLGAARQIFSSRIAESEVLRDWWQREIVDKGIDQQIESSLDQLQFLGESVGDEIVVALPIAALNTDGGPLFLAELDDPAAFRATLEEHLANQPGGAPPVQLLEHPDDPVAEGVEVVIWVTDDLVAAACSADQIAELAARLTAPGASPFLASALHQRLAERYADGVEWLFGIDLAAAMADAAATGGAENAAMLDRMGLLDATTLIAERQRNDVGSSIEAEIRFAGERSGVAAWLAEPAPMATLDFVSADAYLASSAASKDGAELFDELLGMVGSAGGEALDELEAFETEIGIDLRDDLAAAIGGEGTFAVDGPILPVPAWKLVVEVYDPATLEHAIETVIARANDELAANGRPPITITREEVGGRLFTTITHPSSPVPFTYTMTDGFLIAGNGRAAIEHALAVRDSGMGLARSAAFRELLPDNGFTDCSALLYRNLAPIFGALPAGAMGEQLSGYEQLFKETAAPGLFCVYGLSDRILVSGSGPSFAGLAPLFGFNSLMALDGLGETHQNHTDEEPLSSVS